MPFLAAIARWEAAVIVIGSDFIFAWNIVGGRIRLSGFFLGDHANGEAYFTWGRVQFLAVLLGIAGQYVFRFYLNPIKFSDVPDASTSSPQDAGALPSGSSNPETGFQVGKDSSNDCAPGSSPWGAPPAGFWRLVESTGQPFEALVLMDDAVSLNPHERRGWQSIL